MLKQHNICLSGKNSTLQTTLPANDKAVFFSWHTAAKVYQFLSLGLLALKKKSADSKDKAKVYQFLSLGLLDEVAEEDAKGYTKYLLLFLSAVAIGGLMEGGAI